MIYANVELTVQDTKTVANNNIVLYRGDKNVEIRFVIKGNRFTVLDSTYAQMIIKRPSSVSIFSEPAAIQNDTVIFTITEDMIDELKEIGEYTFQIRLYDNSMNARATLPPCNNCLIINKPIAVDGEALVNAAMINDSAIMMAAYSDSDIPEEEIFTDDNAYNRTIWVDGDIITDVRMNKIEDALYYINEKGGGGTATAPYISTSLPESVLVGSGEDFLLDLDFSSPNLGKGSLRVFINDVDVMTTKIDQGVSETVIGSSLFAKGTNMVVVYVLDRVGLMSNSLTFYIRYGGTEVSSTFDAYVAYDYAATVRYYFTPTALDTSLQLTFYMEIDGVTKNGVPCTSDVRSYYTFPTNLAVGNHYCRAWVTDGTTRSNVLTFNLIILDATSLVMASDTINPTVEEGTQLVLDYKVYMKNNTSFITKTYIDGNLVNTGTCTLETAYYRTTSLLEGTHTIKIEAWDVTETYSDFVTWTVTVTPSTYTMLQPASAGSLFMATAYNKSNANENREVWVGTNQDENDIEAQLTNFTFNSENGWVDDELIISGNSWVEIPIAPLANNAQYGFTLDIEFSTKPIGVDDAEVLTLWNEVDNCGIKITTEQLIMRSKSGNQCDLYFPEDETVSAIFVIDRDEKTAKIYLNGVMCEAFALSDYEAAGQKYLEDFTVDSHIFLGGYNKNGYCAIKNIRVYEVALATNEILDNFMSNEKDKAAQRELVEFQKGNTLPTLTVYCDFSGLGKDDKKPCNIVYNSPDVNLYGESFTLDGKHSMLQYQGTSSMQYPIKNYRINPRNADGKVKLDPFNNGVAESRFTLKADFMSSGHWQNTGMAKFVNDCLYNYNPNDEKSMNPAKWWSLQNGGSLKDTRETINGFPCRLILVNDGETTLNEGQQEPTPGNTKDMGVFNFNNDKDNVNTLGLDTEIFPNCISYEVTANSDTSAGAFVPYSEERIINAYLDGTNLYTNYMYQSEFTTAEVNFDGAVSTNSRITWYRNLDSAAWQMGSVANGVFNVAYCSEPYFQLLFFSIGQKENITINGVTYKLNYVSSKEELYEEVFSIIIDEQAELSYLQNSFELRYPDADDVGEDYGYLGMPINEDRTLVDYTLESSNKRTSFISTDYLNGELLIVTKKGTDYKVNCNGVMGGIGILTGSSGSSIELIAETTMFQILVDSDDDYFYLNGTKIYFGDEQTEWIIKEPYTKNVNGLSQEHGLKRVIDWVGNCTDEEFVADFEKYFNKQYVLRYYLLVIVCGMVDNLGKNMMLDTWDGQIWYPRFYDMDTICSYDNSGEIKFDVDIEMAQGYWNTSSSRLWTKVRDLFHDDLVATYKDLRQNNFSYEKFMSYFYGKQIAQIPQTYYNKDYDVKYAPYANEYMGKAHGDGYEHLKRWLKRRLIFTDTLFDYAPSYENDKITIRANTLDLMRLEIETYTPVYQHVSFYNGQMSKEKVDGKTSTTFEGTAQTATDQEVLIYGGSNIKAIRGIQSMNPNSMLIGNASRLTELDISDCPILTVVNSNKANFAPHTYLNKLDISNCPQLGGQLNISNSPLLQEVNALGTAVDNILFPTSVRNLETLRVPKTVNSLTLTDAGLLYTLEMEEGNNLQSISMSNCNNLTEMINFDLTQTPTVFLDNSFNGEEIYMSDTTNLTLRNMPSLKRVIFTPNSEYSAFDINNVLNGANYKITTFNNPKMTDFITTAPHRDSYKLEKYKEYLDEETIHYTTSDMSISQKLNYLDGTSANSSTHKSTDFIPISKGDRLTNLNEDNYNLLKLSECTYGYRLDDTTPTLVTTTNIAIMSSNWIPVTPGKYYTVSAEINGVRTTRYDGTNSFLGRIHVKFADGTYKCGTDYRGELTEDGGFVFSESTIIMPPNAVEFRCQISYTITGVDFTSAEKASAYKIMITESDTVEEARNYSAIPYVDENIVAVYDNDKKYIENISSDDEYKVTEDGYIKIGTSTSNTVRQLVEHKKSSQIIVTKDITPNTAFTANTLDLADTQFQNVKFLCTTDIYNLKVPTTMKNFYADSAMDIDTDVIEDASYEVIHEELIEPYTTNYEGEVVRFRSALQTITIDNFENPNMSFSTGTGELGKYNSYNSTGYMLVQGGTEIAGALGLWIAEYDKDLNYIGYLYFSATNKGTLNNQTRYILISVPKEITSFDITGHFDTLYTPNIIPSSANGSLIFNMYSNNTTQPTSTSPYMWDLTGLKLEDFYTYGMNNWVKPSEDSYVKINTTQLYGATGRYQGKTFRQIDTSAWDALSITPILFAEDIVRIKVTTSSNTGMLHYYSNDYDRSTNTVTTHGFSGGGTSSGYWEGSPTYPIGAGKNAIRLLTFSSYKQVEWFDITTEDVNGIEDTTRFYMKDIPIVTVDELAEKPIIEEFTYKTKLSEIQSITMPQRMPGYSVRLVNADITPDEYPTMLYPKLIDTTLPITGKLDYTKYNGTSLAWVYAYTTGDVTINPLDSRNQGNITNDYNKLYGTDFVDIVDVWIYKDTDVSKLSTNEAITKAYIELTSDNYKTRVNEVLQWYPNCTDLYFFDDGSVTSLYSMMEVSDGSNSHRFQQIQTVTFMEDYFDNLTTLDRTFRHCHNLTKVTNIPNSVKSMAYAFEFAYALQDFNIPTSLNKVYYLLAGNTAFNKELDFSNCPIITDGLTNGFDTAKGLTIPPILPSNYTGSMQSTFRGCSSLTQAPTIPTGVTSMRDTFSGCSSLTQAPTIPQGVTDMQGAFYNCSSLTQVPTIPSGVTTIQSAFYQCTKLTQAPAIPSSVTNMQSCFAGCTSLTQAPAIPEGVTNLNSAFSGCTALRGPFTFPKSANNIDMALFDCKLLTEVTVHLDVYDFIYNNALQSSGVTTINWSGILSANFDVSKLTGSKTKVGQMSIHELVPEHLADLTELGTTATLTLGETFGAYLTPDEVFAANAKGWTIVGTSNDFTIINASDDVSGYTSDENVTSCFIELTSANYKTRIDQVLAHYPNCTDLYLFEDGSMTDLGYLFGADGGDNGIYKMQIENITFMEGHFENVISMYYAIRGLENLKTINNIPDNVTGMSLCFIYCSSLTHISNIPSKVNNLSSAFTGCKSLNQQFDFSNLKLTNISQMFDACTALTYPPILPADLTCSMSRAFQGCSSLTTAPAIPQGVTNMEYTFRNCSSLTTAPVIPNGVTNMSYTFEGCALTQAPAIPNSVTNMSYTFQNCKALTTAPNIPNNVTDMQNCFYKCTSLTQAPNIPNSVTNISMMLALCEKVTSITLPLENIQTYNGALNSTGITDITWVGERNSDFDITSLYFNGCSQEDIKELVPEHLADLTALGTTATLTLGEYASYLSFGEMMLAQSKGWTIEGDFSSGNYAMVNASTNLSEVNSNITTVVIELTSSNYTSRINQVLQYYPSCTDLIFFDDGSVTSLYYMMSGVNTTYKSQIKTVEFLDGYFNNLTDIENAFRDCSSLTTPPVIPQGVTTMKSTFQGCTALTTAPVIPAGVTNMQNTFLGCSSLTTAPTIPNSVTNMYSTFQSCSSLTTAPTIPDGVTDMYSTFYNCTSLTTVPNIPSGVEFMESTFQNCSSLTTVPTIPSSVTDMGYTFYGCKALTTGPKILSTSITDIKSLYSGCTNLQSCEVPIYVDACTSALYNVPSTCDVTWLGERTTDLNVTNKLNHKKANATDIQELVPEHLADLTSQGKTATLTLGSTYLAYLTEDEIAAAVAKGWTLQ